MIFILIDLLCSGVVIEDVNLKNCISYNFSNIRLLIFDTVVKNLFGHAEINCYNSDAIFPSERFEKIVKQRQNYCLFFESCNSPADLIKVFTQTILRVYFSSSHDIFPDFDDSYDLSLFIKKKFSSINIFSPAIALGLLIISLSIM